ncbi:MAG: hypothetical protein WD825_15545 [Gemmatimonadaceae bacterium]
MNRLHRTFSIALVIGVYACARVKCDPVTATCAESAAKVVSVGDEFVLAPGQRVTISDSDLSLEFERVTSDSRCPKDVQCVWAGNAAIRLKVVEQMSEPRLVELDTYGDRQKAQLGMFELQVVALTPDPVSTERIEPRQYRLTLRLTELP